MKINKELMEHLQQIKASKHELLHPELLQELENLQNSKVFDPESFVNEQFKQFSLPELKEHQ